MSIMSPYRDGMTSLDSIAMTIDREGFEALTIKEGKPEQAVPKIVEGRLNGFFKDVCLLEQPYAKDDKQTIEQFIGSAEIVRFAQVEIG